MTDVGGRVDAVDAPLVDHVVAVVATVDDPELPGVSIVDLGMLETVEVDGERGRAMIGLIPTFGGCPALEVIRRDVAAAVAALPGLAAAEVTFLAAPVWTTERVTRRGRERLASELGVAVAVGGETWCPRCGGPTRPRSLFGPTRCRSVHRCTGCGEIVEVLR